MISAVAGYFFNREDHPIIHDVASGCDKVSKVVGGIKIANDLCDWIIRQDDPNHLRLLNEPNCGGLKNMTAKELEKVKKRTQMAIENLESDNKLSSATYRNHFFRCFYERNFTLERVKEINMAVLGNQRKQN